MEVHNPKEFLLLNLQLHTIHVLVFLLLLRFALDTFSLFQHYLFLLHHKKENVHLLFHQQVAKMKDCIFFVI